MEKTLETPLAKYLRRSGISQSEFARRLGAYRGKHMYHPTVWNWTRRAPGATSQMLIELATGGEVTRRAWKAWAAKTEKLSTQAAQTNGTPRGDTSN